MTAPLCTAKRASGWDARGEQPQLRGEPRGLTLSQTAARPFQRKPAPPMVARDLSQTKMSTGKKIREREREIERERERESIDESAA